MIKDCFQYAMRVDWFQGPQGRYRKRGGGALCPGINLCQPKDLEYQHTY